MSITFQRETLTPEFMGEVAPMLQDHYDELTLHKERVKLDPDWTAYFHLQQAGAFVVLTARDNGRLVGYNAFFLNRHIHYRGINLAVNDVFYIHRDYRRGPSALRFLRYAERVLKDLGADKLAYHFKAGNNFAAILERLEYQHEEGVAAKLL